jgi:hypothetical protein
MLRINADVYGAGLLRKTLSTLPWVVYTGGMIDFLILKKRESGLKNDISGSEGSGENP